jgi:hypothetical protein
MGENSTENFEVGISGPCAAHTLWHDALAVPRHSGQVRTLCDGEERSLALKHVQAPVEGGQGCKAIRLRYQSVAERFNCRIKMGGDEVGIGY